MFHALQFGHQQLIGDRIAMEACGGDERRGEFLRGPLYGQGPAEQGAQLGRAERRKQSVRIGADVLDASSKGRRLGRHTIGQPQLCEPLDKVL